jgi:hypothetical protein
LLDKRRVHDCSFPPWLSFWSLGIIERHDFSRVFYQEDAEAYFTSILAGVWSSRF